MTKQLTRYNAKSGSLILLTAALLACFAAPLAAADKPLTDDQKVLYVIGVSVSRSLAVFDLTPEEFEYVRQGLSDAQTGKKDVIELATYTSKIQELAKNRRKISGDRQVGAGKDFLEKAAGEKGAVKTLSGMVYIPVAEGTGASPAAADSVKVNYRGTLIDGTEFDSSYKRAKPLEFKLDAVIKCWTEGLQKMKQGGKARLVCPSHLAYGENGAGDLILPGATLAFDVELLEIRPAASAQPAAPKAEKTVAPDKK